MRPDRLLLEDMLDSINEVIESTPVSQAEFDVNKFVGSHVLRHIQIIGEAAWRLSSSLKDQHLSECRNKTQRYESSFRHSPFVIRI